MATKKCRELIDAAVIGLPQAMADQLYEHLNSEMPAPTVVRDRIKPIAQQLSDDQVDRFADAQVKKTPEYTQRTATLRTGRGWAATRKRENRIATDEARREYDRLPDRVPRAEAEEMTILASVLSTARSFCSYSFPAVFCLAGCIGIFLVLEVLGVQVGTLTNSKETWASDRLTALGFCIGFTLSVVFSTRNYTHLIARIGEAASETDLIRFKRRWAARFVVGSWSSLGAFCLLLGLLHVKEFHPLMTPLRLALMIGGPLLLAASCCYLEGRFEHHRRRVFDRQKVRNPAQRAMRPELHENGTVEANLLAYEGLLDALEEQLETAREESRQAHRAVRDDEALKANGLDAIHADEAEDQELKGRREANQMRRRQRREKLRLYDPDFKIDEDDDSDEDGLPGVAAKLG